jgi:hypothetical protein
MQLDCWTTKAAIATNGRKQRTTDRGMTLPAAIEAAREFQARRAGRG